MHMTSDKEVWATPEKLIMRSFNEGDVNEMDGAFVKLVIPRIIRYQKNVKKEE